MSQNGKTQYARIVIGVPSRGQVRTEWAVALKHLAEPVNTPFAVDCFVGLEVDDARNACVERAREHEAEFVFFLDDDVICPPQALRHLVYLMGQHPDWDLLSGIYVTKTEPPEPLVFNRDESDGAFWNWRYGETFPITGCGMGCCLIRMSAFEKVDAPWFRYLRGYEGQGRVEEGEDLHFCRRLAEAGGVLMADGGTLAAHIDAEGKYHALPQDSRPITAALERNPDAFKNKVLMGQRQ